MARNSRFEWSSLDRRNLYKIMQGIKREVVDLPLKPSKFHKIVSKHIRSLLPIRQRKEFDINTPPGRIMIGGAYYACLDRKKSRSIEIYLSYNPNDRVITMNNERFKRFCKIFADTVLHEIIHMRQARRRNFKTIPGYLSTAELSNQRREQSYLGDSDEIGAYAFNIACELHDKFKGNTKKIAAYLNEHKRIKLKSQNSWVMYLKAFDYRHNHPVIKRIKKRVMYYISRNQVNKPYQSKEWISN